ncbi:MAG: acetylglutamate kinase [Phycisphaerales bacterium]
MNELVLVKVGGSIQDDPVQMRTVMRDVSAIAAAGAKPIVVHGGGKAITAALKDAGIASRFVAGQRYTDEATLKIAERVLNLTVNAELCAMLAEAGARAAPLHSLGSCVLKARRTTETGKPEFPQTDLGLVGRVSKVDAGTILGIAGDGLIPVIAPVALDEEHPPTGRLNVNADLAAGAVAAAVKPGRFILVSDTPGIRTRPDDPSSFAPTLSRAELGALIASGVIDGGMLPKVQACFAALDAGVGHVCIVDGRVGGVLALAAGSGKLVGTRITA